MSTGYSSEMSDVSNDSWTTGLSILKNKPLPCYAQSIPDWKAILLPDLCSETVYPRDGPSPRSSSDSSAPPSPPGLSEANQSERSSPAPPPINTNSKYTLVDLGHYDVANFFKTHSKGIVSEQETTPPTRDAKVGEIKKKTSESKTTKKRAKLPAKAKPTTSTAAGRKLWEFVLGLLCDPATNPSVVRWTDIHNGIFLFTNSRRAASLWGQRRGHPDMTYEHMSRAIRHYYRGGVILRVHGRRLVYKFGANAPDWQRRVKAASKGDLLHALPKDFCDTTTSCDDVAIRSEVISDNQSTTMEHVHHTPGTSPQTPEVKPKVKQVVNVNHQQSSFSITGVTPVSDANTITTNNNIVSEDGSDVVSMEISQDDLLQNVYEPAQQVPGCNRVLSPQRYQMFDSAVGINTDIQSQQCCATQGSACVHQSQHNSENKPSDHHQELLDSLEFQKGFYAGSIDTRVVVDSSDTESDKGQQLINRMANTVHQRYQAKQWQPESLSLPVELTDDYNTLLEPSVNQFDSQLFSHCQLAANSCRSSQQADGEEAQLSLKAQIEALLQNWGDNNLVDFTCS